jgi:hypothetical protein
MSDFLNVGWLHFQHSGKRVTCEVVRLAGCRQILMSENEKAPAL